MTGLEEVARVAYRALDADVLLVVDPGGGHGDEPAVVTRVGDRAPRLCRELGEALAAVAPDVRTWGAHRVRSVGLDDGSGRPVGVLHVGWIGTATVTDHCEPVVRAFARHLGLTLARHSDRVPAVTYADDELLPWEDPDRMPDAIREITGQVTEILGPVTGARAVGITVWDPERQILRALPGAFGSDDDTLAASVTGPVTNMLSAGSRVFACGEPYLSNDAGADPGVLQPYAEVFRIGRLLSVPLEGRCRRVGVLHLANKPTDFTATDIAAVEALAPRLAASVELAGTVERMAAQQRLEGILTATAVAVASGTPLQDCLVPAFDRLGTEIDASVVALVPLGSEPLIRCAGPRPSEELEARLVADARALVTTPSGAYPRHAGDPGWAALHAPVELDGVHTATLAVLRRTGRPFTSQEEDVVGRLSRLVTLAWTTERYQHQLAEIARFRERERIADGLHDRVAQIFFAAGIGIDSVLENRRDAPEDQRLVEVRELLVHGDAIVREVIHQLETRPESGLTWRLRREVEAVEDEFGVVVRVELPDHDLTLVSKPVVDAAVRVAREGIVNAAKHAGPCRIGLWVDASADGLAVAVVDDGFDAGSDARARARASTASGRGLTSLRRTVEDVGGTLTVDSAAGGFGTRVRASFPL